MLIREWLRWYLEHDTIPLPMTHNVAFIVLRGERAYTAVMIADELREKHDVAVPVAQVQNVLMLLHRQGFLTNSGEFYAVKTVFEAA